MMNEEEGDIFETSNNTDIVITEENIKESIKTNNR